MTTARCKIVDLDVTRYYHCISRCVRGAFLCGNGFEHRKQWLENRLEQLAGSFAVAVAGFAVMDNHLHVLIRMDPDVAKGWSDEEVLKRWISVYRPREVDFDDPDSVQSWVEDHVGEQKKVAEYRERLSNMGWFMKSLKEPLSRMANKEDGKKGAFWDARYKSIGVLDEEGLLATCAYIDLNPVAAGTSSKPETSKFTSLRQRVQHVATKGKLNALKSAKQGSIKASRKIGNAEQDHWLIPFEDRRPHTNSQPVSDREGMLEKFTLGNYLLLVEYIGRLFRKGKARITDDVKQIFDRLNTTFEAWMDQVEKMLHTKELRGRTFSGAQ